MRKQIIQDCLRVAQKQAKEQNHPEYDNYLHWSFIVQDGKVLGFGRNRPGKPYYDKFGYTTLSKIHAEHDAYRKIKGLLNNSRTFDILNIRLNRQGKMRLSKPCSCCAIFLKFMGCKNVIFSTDCGFARIRFEK